MDEDAVGLAPVDQHIDREFELAHDDPIDLMAKTVMENHGKITLNSMVDRVLLPAITQGGCQY